jgi:hypothetical protein
MRYQNIYWWLFGVSLIALGVLQGVLSGWTDNTAATGLITSGIIVMVFLLSKELRMNERPKQDERAKKIGAWGLSYSWFLTFLTLFILFWARYLNLLMPDTTTVIVFLMLEMALSARVLQWYLFRKGDVE